MTKKLDYALFDLKKELGCTISADASGQYGSYVPLETVLSVLHPLLLKHGLLLVQFPNIVGDKPVLVTRITHIESGEFYEVGHLLVVEKPGPQGLGAAETYARRRTLMCIFGLATEDDPDAKGGQPTLQSIAHSKAASQSRAPKGNHTGIANKVIRCGKKFAGMKYGDCDLSELQNYAQWLQRTSQEQGKEMNDYAIEFCDDLLKLERESSGFAPMDGVPF